MNKHDPNFSSRAAHKFRLMYRARARRRRALELGSYFSIYAPHAGGAHKLARFRFSHTESFEVVAFQLSPLIMHFPTRNTFDSRVEVDSRWFRLAWMMNEGFRDKKSEWRSGPIEANGIRLSQATMTVGKLFVMEPNCSDHNAHRPLGNGEHLTREKCPSSDRHPCSLTKTTH